MFDPSDATVEAGTEPFTWLVADGAFDDAVLARVVDEWPSFDDPRWIDYRAQQEFRKFEGSDAELWSPTAAAVLHALGAPDTVAWITDQLHLPDRDLTALTVGGGYHATVGGGYLAPHADFNGHPVDGRWRRVNVLLFLVRDYDPAWGGCLRLGEPGGASAKVVEPRFGRLVAFETSSTSWHGHPDPWLGPTPRRSLATYYFSAGPPPEDVEKHGTRWYADEPARVEREALHTALTAAESAATAARSDAEHWHREADARAQELAEVEHSRSWRVTAPLRAVSGWTRR